MVWASLHLDTFTPFGLFLQLCCITSTPFHSRLASLHLRCTTSTPFHSRLASLHLRCTTSTPFHSEGVSGCAAKLQKSGMGCKEAQFLTPEVYMQRCVTSLMLQRTVSLSFYAAKLQRQTSTPFHSEGCASNQPRGMG